MNNPNRYEDVPQKENKFAKGLKAFGRYIKFVFVDFFNSFKYNNMKLAAILFALPGILLGFFMFAHVPTIRHVTVSYQRSVEGTNVLITPELNTDTSDDTSDYKLILGEYDGNKNVVLVKESLDTSAKGFNQDTSPIDGYSTKDGQTQLTTPKVSSISQLNADSYGITIVIPEEEQSKVSSFAIFIYQKVNVAENNNQYYFFTQSSYTYGDANVQLTRLSKGVTYAVAVKAIAKNSDYYSSKLSTLNNEVEFIPESSGTSASSEDYDDANAKFIQYAGNYKVSLVDGKAPTGDIADLTVNVKASGNLVYKYAGNTINARLTTSGTNLQSNAQETINILPFDFSAIAIFVLTLFGFLNVFLSLELSKKKNLGSVIKAALITGAIIIIGGLYIYAITQSGTAIANGYVKLENVTTIYDSNCITSIGVVIASAVFSLAGLILAFINYDRTYEKVDR